MLRLPLPTKDAEEFYLECVSSTKDANLKSQLEGSSNTIRLADVQYQVLATTQSLHSYQSKPALPVLQLNGGKAAGTDEYYRIYSRGCSSGPGRYLYDQIKKLADGKCAYCGVLPVDGLDHYLPRGQFRELAVVPVNLVPSCDTCNEKPGKGTHVPSTLDDLIFHPYFESMPSDQWLFAKVNFDDDGYSVNYFAKKPNNSPGFSQERLSFNLKKLRWNYIFALRANTHITHVIVELEQARDSAIYVNPNYVVNIAYVRQHISGMADKKYSDFKNRWDTALYQALADNFLFCWSVVKRLNS